MFSHSGKGLHRAKTGRYGRFKLRLALSSQIAANMRRTSVFAMQAHAFTGKINGFQGNFVLCQVAAPRHLLYNRAAIVARIEVHGGINICRVLAQSIFNHAYRIDKAFPVNRFNGTQTVEAIAHGKLAGSLHLVFHLHKLVDCLTRVGKLLLNPRER